MKVATAEKPDPFDVDALEKSLNDSATRVSTIWISFLIFGLYLVVAAGAVTHRQLLLEDPVKLPILNIDLPLVGYFFLTPILFLVLHIYVLIQVLLLARTAAAYNKALDRAVKSPTGNAAMRQRLANTLFAQIFAGAPREREGLLGWVLRMISWLTLAIAPTFVLLTFQFKFLPYHSHLITWTIRILIFLELIAVLVLWRGTLQEDRDLSLRSILRSWLALPSALALTAFSWAALTFPGEPHAQWTRYWEEEKERPQQFFECETTSPISKVSPSFDRLSLVGVDVVSEEILAKVKKAEVENRKVFAPTLKFTRSFQNRDLSCSTLRGADLRSMDLTHANLRGSDLYWANLDDADLNWAELQGAYLFSARLRDAHLYSVDLRNASLAFAHLENANLSGARLQGAVLDYAVLRGANLTQAKLQGADLSNATLVGSDLSNATLVGANLSNATLVGANLIQAQLQGAVLNQAELQLASLYGTQLQGADLDGADLSGASIESAGLQGANLNKTSMQSTKVSNTYVWRAKNAACTEAQISGQLSDALLTTLDKDNDSPSLGIRTIPMTADNIVKFIEESVGGIADRKSKEAAIGRIRSGLSVDPAMDDDTSAIEKVWRKCEQISQEVPESDFKKKAAAFLRALFCDAKYRLCTGRLLCDGQSIADTIAERIMRNWISDDEDRRDLSGLLSEDGSCAASKELSEEIRERLRDAIKVRSLPTGESRQN
jgi:uncharacterized protein YjbI with pentapeptide repeats